MTSDNSARNRLPLWLFWGGLALILGWLGLKAWRINAAAQDLLTRQAEVESLAAGGLTEIDPEAAESLLLAVRRDVVILKRETAVFMPLLSRLDWLPGKWGPTAAAAPHLLDMADAGTETAVHAFRGLKPGLSLLAGSPGAGDSMLASMVGVLAAAEPDLKAANQSFARLVAARQSLGDTEALPWRVRTLLETGDEWLPLGAAGLKIAPYLAPLLGSEGPRRYLIIAQNEDEIRATGGFITGAGMLVVEDGRILEMDFQDSYKVDNWAGKPYDLPPPPLQAFMGLDMFLFRDANFWPDFPTSAEKAMALFEYGQDSPSLDGVFSVDQQFLQMLIEATGPIDVPDSDITINKNNLLDQIHQAWAIEDEQTVRDWVFNRKAFLSAFAAAIRSRLETDFSAIDPVLLAQNLYEAAETKRLQIYMKDAGLAAVLQELGWDGRVPSPTQGDFLMVVDSNLGYSKANFFTERSVDYEVALQPDGTAVATVNLTYRHTGPPGEGVCIQDLSYYSDRPQYLDGANRCFWNYVRVYTPQGSALLTASSHPVPGDTLISGKTWPGTAVTLDERPDLTTFANYFVVPQAGTETSSFQYQLPVVVREENGVFTYQLALYKQAGQDAEPHTITVSLPPGALLQTAMPAPTLIEGEHVHLAFELKKDTVISLTYQ